MNIMIYGKELEQVEQFKYVGSILTSDGKYSSEIRARVAMEKMPSTREKSF